MQTSQYPQTLEGKTCTDQNLFPFPFPQRSVGILNNIPKFYVRNIRYKTIPDIKLYMVTIRIIT